MTPPDGPNSLAMLSPVFEYKPTIYLERMSLSAEPSPNLIKASSPTMPESSLGLSDISVDLNVIFDTGCVHAINVLTKTVRASNSVNARSLEGIK
jgi:hypothetical protein